MLLIAAVCAQACTKPRTLEDGLPKLHTEGGYLSSQRCQPCHPAQYQSWRQTLHRTMTQPAGPESVLAPFDGRTLTALDRPFTVFQEQGAYLVEMDDPDNPEERTTKRVVMTTGSSEEQRYWVERGKGRRLDLLPMAFVVREQRWVNARDLFFGEPRPEVGVRKGTWNDKCVACHATGGQPRVEGSDADTRVAELGIACEACHGPGQAHVRAMQSGDVTGGFQIVHPAKLDKAPAAQVCGQCHLAYRVRNIEAWREAGWSYRPGGDIKVDRSVLRPDPYGSQITSRYWGDGTISVGGREYNGLIESACYQQGDLTCTNCHSMHSFNEPRKLLRPGQDRCLGCHDQLAENHSHHESGSSGSVCQNCHMPHTTWGLLKAMPSHRITRPVVDRARPNACNLCHLDKSLQWTAEHLSEWYAQPSPVLSEEEARTSAALLWLIQGHALERAVAAWSMGWSPAKEASGADWQPPFLAELLVDDYAAVRLAAHRTLLSFPGYEDLAFDYVGDKAGQRQARAQAIARWPGTELRGEDRTALVLTNDGAVDTARLELLRLNRDETQVRVAE